MWNKKIDASIVFCALHIANGVRKGKLFALYHTECYSSETKYLYLEPSLLTIGLLFLKWLKSETWK